MSKLNAAAIRKALLPLNCRAWGVMKRNFGALAEGELAEAETIEKLGGRRHNVMKIILAERKRRAGKGEKMLRLKMETNL